MYDIASWFFFLVFFLACNTFCAVCRSGACDFHKVSFSLFFLLGIVKTDHNNGNYMPYSLRQVCGFFYVPQDYKHWSNAALSPQLFKDPECWSGRSWTHDLSRDSPVLNRLSHRCSSKPSFLRIDERALWRMPLMVVVFFMWQKLPSLFNRDLNQRQRHRQRGRHSK